MPLRSWVVSTMASPSSLSSAEQVEDLVAGADVDARGRLVEEQQIGLPSRARAMNTRCCWPPESSRMWRSAEVADAQPVEHRRSTSAPLGRAWATAAPSPWREPSARTRPR